MVKFVCILAVIIGVGTLSAQDLTKERIRKIPTDKKSIFFSDGIFHNGGAKTSSTLKAIRHSFSNNTGYERIVLDFATETSPRIYGQIDKSRRFISIDFFKTKLMKKVGSFGKSKYVKEFKVYPISDEELTIQIEFNKPITVDIFTLKDHGRLVLDVKE